MGIRSTSKAIWPGNEGYVRNAGSNSRFLLPPSQLNPPIGANPPIGVNRRQVLPHRNSMGVDARGCRRKKPILAPETVLRGMPIRQVDVPPFGMFEPATANTGRPTRRRFENGSLTDAYLSIAGSGETDGPNGARRYPLSPNCEMSRRGRQGPALPRPH